MCDIAFASVFVSRCTCFAPPRFPPGWTTETKETACANGCGQLNVYRDYGCLYSDTDLYAREGHRLAIVSMYDNIDPGLKQLTKTNKERYAKKRTSTTWEWKTNRKAGARPHPAESGFFSLFPLLCRQMVTCFTT